MIIDEGQCRYVRLEKCIAVESFWSEVERYSAWSGNGCSIIEAFYNEK